MFIEANKSSNWITNIPKQDRIAGYRKTTNLHRAVATGKLLSHYDVIWKKPTHVRGKFKFSKFTRLIQIEKAKKSFICIWCQCQFTPQLDYNTSWHFYWLCGYCNNVRFITRKKHSPLFRKIAKVFKLRNVYDKSSNSSISITPRTFTPCLSYVSKVLLS